MECLGTFHLEAVDDEELVKVTHPGTQRGCEWMSVAEVDSHNPPGPGLDVRVRVEIAHQAFNREREHARNTELWDPVNAGLTLMRKIALLELGAAFWADMFCPVTPRSACRFGRGCTH